MKEIRENTENMVAKRATPKNRVGKQKLTELVMALSRIVVEGTGDKSKPVIDKFVQEQLDTLLKSPKLHELIERVSFQESISKDKALKTVLEEMVNRVEDVSKGKKKSAASLELVLR